MRLGMIAGLALTIVLAGCASSASGPTPTATAVSVTAQTTTTVPPTAAPTPTVVIGKPYADFLRTLCHAFATKDAGTVINLLPYYQYNNGLRYGNLGDGEGSTGAPNLMKIWLASGPVTCVSFTPGIAGHGTLLTSGWHLRHRWSLLDLDIFNGHWKINDFTFGTRAQLDYALRTASPILPYHGQ